MDILILLGSLFILFALGVPIAYSLGLAAIAGALWIGVPLEAVMLKISDGVSKVAMLTIPFFVLAGAIMAEGGMAKRLVAFANVLVGWSVCAVGCRRSAWSRRRFSPASGSSVADVSAIGSVMIPQMEKIGYPRAFAPTSRSALRCRRYWCLQPQRGDLFAGHRRAQSRSPACSWPAWCPACCSARR
jgi:TRAP-type mannitol/chloroaromatic compound transport system permease large subunit